MKLPICHRLCCSMLSKLPVAWPFWSLVSPVIAAVLLGVLMTVQLTGLLTSLVALVLMTAVLSAVHHAEVIAHRLGEPFGSLVLAVAVTVIEVALIISLMLAGGEAAAATARDTVFSAVMIVLNGVVGLCILLGGLRQKSTDAVHHDRRYRARHGPDAPIAG